MSRNTKRARGSSSAAEPRDHSQSMGYQIRVHGADMQARLEKLSHFHFIPTRGLHRQTLDDLGILEAIEHYIHGIGWTGVASLDAPSYREPTIEFLSSLVCVAPSEDIPYFRVHYQLNNRRFQESLAAFNIAMGFETPDSIETDEYIDALRDIPEDFIDEAFWVEITGQPGYDPRLSKSTAIQDPALRIFHRWIATGVFARNDSTGNVSRIHLFLLWAAVHGRRIDAGRFFIISYLSIGQHQRAGQKGYIGIGSFITRLSQTQDAFHPSSTKMCEFEHMTYDTWFRMGLLARGPRGKFILRPDEAEAEQQPEAEQEVEQQQPHPEPFIPQDPGIAEQHPPVHDLAQRLDHLQLRVDGLYDRFDQATAQQQQQFASFQEAVSQRMDGHFASIMQFLQGQMGPPPPQ